ncbi:MAG: hypothetical protein ACK5MT_02590 [Actinomycetales bacterium]
MPQPTGAMHEVHVNELFFSTTDLKGRIQLANSVFVDMSRYPLNKLIGAPHNVIRHPDMPGGAFKIIWDRIGDQKPTCAYVKNLGADGSAYWAFATITPVDGGYLSVRSLPCRQDVLDQVERMYHTARDSELERGGVSAAAAAANGADSLAKSLAEAGFDSYETFQLHALPAEVEARAKLASELPARRSDGQYGEMYAGVRQIDSQIRALFGDLASFQELASTLDDRVLSSHGVVESLDTAINEARLTAERLADRAPVLASSAGPMHVQCTKVKDALQSLHRQVDGVLSNRAELRFTVALCALQSETLGRYIAGVMDGKEDRVDAEPTSAALTGTLTTQLQDLAERLDANIATTKQMAGDLEDARMAFERIQRLATAWRALIERNKVESHFDEYLPLLDSALEDGTVQLESLMDSAKSFESSAVGFNPALLLARLARVRSSARG